MPENKFAIARYKLIDRILRKTDYVKTSLLVEVCERELGYSVTQRTIQSDLEAMKHDTYLRFFAPVEYCKKRKAYYYSHTDFNLFTPRFSAQELEVLSLVNKLICGQISEEYHLIFNDIVERIKKMEM